MQVNEILETCLYVNDLAAAEAFYRDVLGLKVFSSVKDRHVFFRCGNRMLLLFNPEKTLQSEEVPPHGTSGAGHVCFAVPLTEIPGWIEHLQAQGVTIEAEVTWTGENRSIYFRDPAGNSLEIGTPKIWNLPEEDAF